MHRYHAHRPVQKDPTALPLRILCALLGATAGFTAGRLYGPQELLPPEKTAKPAAVKTAQETAGMGVPASERILGVMRMDRDALAGVLAAIQQEFERDGPRPEVRDRAEMQLRALFARWTDLDGPGALKAALTVKNRALMALAATSACAEWARRAPSDAVQSLTSLQNSAMLRDASEVIVRAGAPRDPVAVLQLIPKISGTPALLLTGALGAEWMRLDASHALRRLMTEPAVNPAQSSSRAMGQWMLENPAGLLKWRRLNVNVAETAPVLHFDTGEFTPGRLTACGMALAESFGSEAAGREWLLKAADYTGLELLTFTAPLAELGRQYLESWKAAEEKLPPGSTVTGWLSRATHAATIRSLAAQFAGFDAAAALSWAATLPEAEAQEAAATIAAAWLGDAPASAPAKLFAGDMSTPAGRAAAAAGVNRLVRSDPVKALDSLPGLKLEASLNESLQAGALAQLSRTSPEGMLEWLAAHPGAKPPADAVSTALKSVAVLNPARALEHVRAHSAPDAVPRESAAILSVWLTRDRSGALGFLQSLPDGPERDACTEALAAADLAMTDPFFAANVLPESFEAALRLRDNTARIAKLRALLARMKQLKVSTQPSLALPGLKPADREAITKNS